MSSDAYFEEDLLWEGGFDRAIFTRLVRYVRPHMKVLLLTFGLVSLTTAFYLVMPYVLRLVVNDVNPTATTHTFWNLETGKGKLFRWFAVAYLVCEVLRFVNTYAQQFWLQVLGQRVIHDIRMHLFRRLQGMALSFFHKHPVGRLVTRVAFDVESLSEMFSQGLVTVVLDVFLVTGISVCLVVVDWQLGLLTLVVLPFLVGVTIWFRHFIRETYREVAKHRSILNAYTAENINGMREVQAFTREAAHFDVYSGKNDALMSHYLTAIHRYAMFMPSFRILAAVATAIVISVVGVAVLDREIQLGLFAQFFFLVRMLVDPLRDLAEKYNILQNAMASADRIFTIMDNPPDPALATPRWNGDRPAVDGGLTFDAVGFEYVAGEPVLRDISFEVAPGESVAIVGHTGAGKTTLFNLLTRFYDVDSGAIRLDGTDLREWHPEELRGQITIVSQDVFLFAGDIRGNIAMGDEYSDEQVEEAATLVGAHQFITALPGGYDEPVVEGGATLSAGQRQLIGFARAILRDSRVLGLDEATSSVDTRTEKLIQKALQTITSGRTSLIIAHRLSTIQRCDRIILLHKGRVAEIGTHQELLAKRGGYYKLYQLQYAGQA